MRALVQKVKEAEVKVEGASVGKIGRGLLVYLGVEDDDQEKDLAYTAKKIAKLRIFYDQEGKMNQSLLDQGGEVLLISQFTLYGDCRKGNRPSFIRAARPDKAEALYLELKGALEDQGIQVKTGRFQADMAVYSINDGPVTILVDSYKEF